MAKRIGIISDTHGLLRPEVISILKTCDCILHAGDVDRPEILDQLRYLGSLYVVREIMTVTGPKSFQLHCDLK